MKQIINPQAKTSAASTMMPRYRKTLLMVALFSAVANLLMLTGPLFMLQIYDRVLTSQSVPTLMALAVIVGVLFLFYGLFEFVRGRIMGRLGNLLDHHLNEEAFSLYVGSPLKGGKQAQMRPLQDLQQVRRFLASPAALALFDLPWMPLYLMIVFLLHPVLGWVATIGGIFLVVIALINERLSRKVLQDAQNHSNEEMNLAQSVRSSAESLKALGMLGAMQGQFARHHDEAVLASDKAASYTSLFGSMTKSFRLAIQSAILGTGAYLAIAGEMSAGAMIAASIIFARALAPVEQIIGQWRMIAMARVSWHRLKEVFDRPKEAEPMAVLSSPERLLSVSELGVAPPGGRKMLINQVAFILRAGEGLGIVGNSGSGKSTLARALIGAWPAARGEIRLDGATLDQWSPEILGKSIGYMPQDIVLFDGTVLENISRFSADASFESVQKAGELSGAHEMILQLPQGYDTRLGGLDGVQLSAGQRQRVALARAVFGDPFLVVLDEPNSNLDAQGDAALNQAILALRKQGSIVLVVAHRTNVLSTLDKLLVMEAGQVHMFGPRAEVLARLKKLGEKQKSAKELKLVN